jgi:hypothetical protein
MDSNRKLILSEFNSLKGQFVITGSHNIERLVAVGSDDMDYYWITYNGRKLSWSSCVGRIMPLKGHLRDNDYKELIRLAKLNHYDQVTLWGNDEPKKAKEYSTQHKELLISGIGENDEFITDICWDLN